MITLKEVEMSIAEIQKLLSMTTNPVEVKLLEGRLVFLLDIRELLKLQRCNGKLPKESEN